MNDAFKRLAGLGAIKAWLAGHLPFLREGGSLAPRAIVLTGLPGIGKHRVSRELRLQGHSRRIEGTGRLKVSGGRRARDVLRNALFYLPCPDSTPTQSHVARRPKAAWLGLDTR
jgi:hypothetical protein